MISSNLDGGLGNMLFQIAAGYAHSLRINSRFFLLDSSKNFREDYFDQMSDQISKKFAKKTVHSWEKYKNNIFSKIPIHQHKSLELVKQGCFNYTPIPRKDNIIIEEPIELGFEEVNKLDLYIEVNNFKNYLYIPENINLLPSNTV